MSDIKTFDELGEEHRIAGEAFFEQKDLLYRTPVGALNHITELNEIILGLIDLYKFERRKNLFALQQREV